MNRDDQSIPPPRWDPEFSAPPRTGDKGRPGARAGGELALGARGWLPWFFLAILGVGFWSNPLVGPVLVGAAKLAALTLGIVIAAMLLGWIGIGIFAGGEWILAELRGNNRWPDE